MRKHLFLASLALGLLSPCSRAAEHVTLRNGYEMLCDHHTSAGTQIRLFVSADEGNYIEFAAGDIASIEHAADPLPSPRPLPDQTVSPSAPASSSTNARLSPADLHEILAKAGTTRNLDVDLLASLVKAESGGNSRAVSRSGARGLMQLMPGTAAELGVSDSFRPDQNVRGGSAYLDSLLTRYHEKLALALAAYNAGPAAVDKYHGIPPYRETRAYVARVIHEFNRRVRARAPFAQQSRSIPPGH